MNDSGYYVFLYRVVGIVGQAEELFQRLTQLVEIREKLYSALLLVRQGDVTMEQMRDLLAESRNEWLPRVDFEKLATA